ncbi:ferredoxin reductase [Solimonas sp. K1W22B-7]|uniref:ferredoxin reductase n=1 Tax=Solimonas sp. K1W22B-7 TaxID=2303331 RepID=UPI000E334A68|nr:ferredoxin reductase [Solimonas sp. K1W22B-7]AXQ31173.1 ferredoxin reductase [Solimonas sp. K1W22B-7]
MNSLSSPARLLGAAVSAPVFDFWSRQFGSIQAWDRCLARVVARQQESANAVSLTLQPNRRFGGFEPGQHVNLTAEVEGVRVTRSYSFTQPPRADGLLRLTIKQVEGGKLSTALCALRPGAVVELGEAYGEMNLPQGPGRYLFLAAGSGITPLMSLSLALEQNPQAEATLVYWAQQRAELCYAEELRQLAARLPRLRLHFVLTREPLRLAGELARRLDAGLLETLAPDLDALQVYACGPRGFVDQARLLAQGRALRFHGEAFTPPALAPGGGSVRVTLRASGRSLDVPSGVPLLAALEAQGLRPESGCRMGLCNTCACRLVEGVGQNLNNGETISEPGSELRICTSAARSDLTLDL